MPKLTYHPGVMADYIAAVNTASAQLNETQTRCASIVHGVVTPEHYAGDAASATAEIMSDINQAIQAGSDVINRHGSTVDTALGNFMAQDAAGASGMRSI
jgi:uncharacterized protein YukE